MPFRQRQGGRLAGVDPRTGTGYPREWDRVAPSAEGRTAPQRPMMSSDEFKAFMEKRLEQLEQESQTEEFRKALREGKAT